MPPKTVDLPLCRYSTPNQARRPAAAPNCVLINAVTAKLPADNALPALNPNQPIQSKDAPSIVIGILCGTIADFP